MPVVGSTSLQYFPAHKSGMETIKEELEGTKMQDGVEIDDTMEDNAICDENDNHDDSNDNEPDDASSSSSSSLLVDVPLMTNPSATTAVIHQPSKLEEPPEGLAWNDNAILQCFQLAQSTHDMTTTTEATSSNSMIWEKPVNSFFEGSTADLEFLTKWKPKELTL